MNWLIIYGIFHILIGLLGWGWFYYAACQAYKGKSLPILARFAFLVVGMLGGPVSFLFAVITLRQSRLPLKFGFKL